MNNKNVLYGIAAVILAYTLGRGRGYLDCMEDVADQHSDILPEGKLTLKGGKNKRKYSITVSKPKAKES